MALRGEVFRHMDNRLTQRIELGGKSYFIKQHFGVGWGEIFKNLFQGRLPIISASNEWRALEKLKTLQVAAPKLMGYGERGMNPATLQSFVIMEALTETISLETLCATWQKEPPTFAFKHRLIKAVADIARIVHTNGMNHRDFYLCHFLLDISQGLPLAMTAETVTLSLIDLHRTQHREVTPERWIVKDLAGLLFSANDIGLTKRDWYRFAKYYSARPLRDVLALEEAFWQKVITRGITYRDHTKE